ncbi:uncharacterized protein ATNIH1004_001984 [Aspergillus tanneri]|uniref:Uncharacterized protein n=1 Tax=Aspergillus tanneri TaxID=1220188 RepID=A0A5M9M2V8_9EURO|nr:uncharacterized protein ATNIH1004_001984 [Aspergillus tanneri]KAA8641382.1 hypothetical protein ATNIH1004_001984 [Aspergillus tanneri]
MSFAVERGAAIASVAVVMLLSTDDNPLLQGDSGPPCSLHKTQPSTGGITRPGSWCSTGVLPARFTGAGSGAAAGWALAAPRPALRVIFHAGQVTARSALQVAS